MANIWFISDTHFGHENILTFTNYDGTKMRPFLTCQEMHQCILDSWNETVKQGDKVYHLGDFGFGRWGRDMLPEVAKLPGKKRLVLGNHDKYNISEYQKTFPEIFGVKQMEGFWLSHAPLHSNSLKNRWAKANIHGHLHNNTMEDPGYYNVSVERINYTPINFDVIRSSFNDG